MGRVKIAGLNVEGGWKGYYRLMINGSVVEETMPKIRKTEYDAIKDATRVVQCLGRSMRLPIITNECNNCC